MSDMDKEYKATTKKKLWDKTLKLTKLIDDIEEIKKTSFDMDYEDCCIIDNNEWKCYWTQEDNHNEQMEAYEEDLQTWKDNYKEEKEKNVALKKQMDQQHEELQEIKKKLKELLEQ